MKHRLLGLWTAAVTAVGTSLAASAASLNPATGDEGINPLIWVVLGVAVVAVLVAALVPALTKKKGDGDRRDR